MFIGREKELLKLNAMYTADDFEMAVIYGRRRIGKTTLIKEFCKDKKSIYFVAREAVDMLNLENFSKDVLAITSPDSAGLANFTSWEQALEYLFKIARDERIILVIDEYPYLAQSNKAISMILQAHIDNKFKDSRLFLILCGSSMSFMEYQVLGYESPLYGRRTAQFKIRPFDFFESILFHDGFNNEDKAIVYGLTGGVPEYLIKIKDTLPVRENILELFLNDNGHLFEEPSSLLKQELREPAVYNTIITAIAKGASKLNEIATKSGLETNKCSKYLSSLMALGIIRKAKPVNEENSRKSMYLIEDNMFKFWYRFVPDNLTLIVSGNTEKLYDKVIQPLISGYMGKIFEQICMQHLIRMNAQEKLPFFFTTIGSWWGGNLMTKQSEEIDIMALDKEDNILLAECKWTNALVDTDVISGLLSKGALFNKKNAYYYFFSKSGFTDKSKQLVKEQAIRINLIAFDEMFV